MVRIPTPTIEDAPAAARPLAEMIQFSPAGRLLNMHAQMAHAPAVLEANVPIRRVTARHTTLDQRACAALMLDPAAADASPYALAIISLLALRSGWQPGQVEAPLAGRDVGENKLDALTSVAGEAAANSGRVSDEPSESAARHGWGERLPRRRAYRRAVGRVLAAPLHRIPGEPNGLPAVPAAPIQDHLGLPGRERRRRIPAGRRPGRGLRHAPHHPALGNRSMIFTDPAGNLVNVFSPSQPTPG
jgi:hypothetical protein